MKIRLVFASLLLFSTQLIFSQKLFDKIKSLGDKVPDVDKFIRGEEPLTTGLAGAVFEVPSMDSFNPDIILPANQLPRNSDGSFLMSPGVWEFNLEGYCMQAGTYGPTKSDGNGHSYAPLQGPKADIIRSILNNTFKHPDILQRDVQTLIWAIIARQNIKDMQPKYMLIAARLLDPKQILRLNDGVLRKLAQSQLNNLLAKSPPALRAVLEAENKMREMLTDVNTKYEELERVAVLTGIMPDDGGRKILQGRWSKTPQGFFIRYFPETYSKMTFQLYVPKDAYTETAYIPLKSSSGSTASVHGMLVPYRQLKQFNPSDHPGVPPGRGQRLGPSNKKSSDPDKRNDALDRANRILKFKSDAETGYGLATDPFGTIMGKINPFTPDNMFDNILEFITDNGRMISDALNGDPPDPNYAVFAKPEVFDYKALNQEPFEDSVMNRISNDFITSYLDVHALMRALAKSNDRLGGANIANDQFWSNKQGNAIMFYKKKVGVGLLNACAKWEIYLNALRSKFGSIPLKPENISTYQEQLRTNGFSKEELKSFAFLGMNDLEIQELKKTRLAYNPSEFKGDYIDKSFKILNAWKTIGELYSNFPDVPAPWD
jgi:hypothetical protein